VLRIRDDNLVSRILFFPIPDPTRDTKEGENFVVLSYSVATNFRELKIILFLIIHREKKMSPVTKNYNTFDQCYGSGMFIPDPDFYPSRIRDLGSRIQKQQQ
jgi:hypothetical protein